MKLPRGLALVLAGGVAPALARWASAQEKRILREGESLPGGLLDFARELGITAPDEIRVMVVPIIPMPVPHRVIVWLRWMGFPVFAPIGMALGKGIYLLKECESSLPHELVHVAQYERGGGIARFMKEYITQCLAEGYADASFEKEARSKGG